MRDVLSLAAAVGTVLLDLLAAMTAGFGLAMIVQKVRGK